MVRGRDACWEHCVLVDANRQKVRCNYCQREFSGGVYRMKFHLAQMRNKDIVPCTQVPTDVRDHILSILSAPKKPKPAKKHKADHQSSSSASGGESSAQNGTAAPSLLFPILSPTMQPPPLGVTQRKKQDEADEKIAHFFFHNFVPFTAAKSVYYQEMVDSIVECGVGYIAPSDEALSLSLLEKAKCDVHDRYKRYRDDWKETGCTVLCDSWSDRKTKLLVAFSVTSPKGTMFLKSVDLSDHKDDANYLFQLIESVILELGVENVVQVITTDDDASFVYAGRLVMAKYSSLFWSPCASRCIDKVLEDIGSLDWVNSVLKEAKAMTRYIYSDPWSSNAMRKFTGGRELIRPKINRYVANFLSLRSIVIQEDNLKHMFSHPDWSSSSHSRCPEAQSVKSLLRSEAFWKRAREAVSVSEPLVKLLRVVDGDSPAMGYVFKGIEQAKIGIKAYYKGVEDRYKLIWDVIERRLSVHLHSCLHLAAAFLNPSVFYDPSFKADSRLRNGFQQAMLKMATTENDKIEVTKEHPVYVNAQGALGTDFAIRGRTLNAPGDWWSSYGYEIPTLQRVAVRILSQPCGSKWTRWNWTTFNTLHRNRRSDVESEKLNDLVFVHCNLWLQGGFQGSLKCKPVVFDEIDVGSAWPTELDISAPVLDDSWLDNLDLDIRANSPEK